MQLGLIHTLHEQELSPEQIIACARYVTAPRLSCLGDSADSRYLSVQMTTIAAECAGTASAQVQNNGRKHRDIVIGSDIEKVQAQIGGLDSAKTALYLL